MSKLSKGIDLANEATAFITAVQPEIAAVIALVKFIRGVYQKDNPEATDAELNAALGPTLVQALSEAEILQAEIDKTKAEIAGRE